MREVLTGWWAQRSAREQRMLFVMFALFALVGAWLLVLRPLGDATDVAERRHAAAVAALAQVRARAGAESRPSGPGAVALPVEPFLRSGAVQAGFADARISAAGPGRARVTISAARPPALFGWLAEVEARGYRVHALQAVPNQDRTLRVVALIGSGS